MTVLREIRVEGLQDRHDAGLEVVLAEGLAEEVGEDLGGQAAQLAEQGGIVAEEGADALGDGEHPLPMRNVREHVVQTPLLDVAAALGIGLTQQAVADRLGVRQGTISKSESKGDVELGPTLLRALAAALARESRTA